MTSNLRMPEADWKRLREHCQTSFRPGNPPETGALGLLGECRVGQRQTFLLVKLMYPGPGDLSVATNGSLVFASSYIRRAHLAVREAGLAGLAFIHTHPRATTRVGFSLYDDQQEPLLVENLLELHPQTQIVSIVLGRDSQCGRVWLDARHNKLLNELALVGEALRFLPLDGTPAPPPPVPEAIFDRGLPLTGAGALALLHRLTVVVAGASGTGTLLCELLARAGCRRILLIDFDIVTTINLNRMLYATLQDAKDRRRKTEVVRSAIEQSGLDCTVEPIHGSILDRRILSQVRAADVIFGGLDRAFPRHFLSEFAYRYVLPYIDVGSEIGGDDRGIVSLDSRASYVAPGRPCLSCTGIVTPRQLHFESLSAVERQRHAQLGYSDDLLIEKPAVMDLNMPSASKGVMLLRHLLQPFLLKPLPVTWSENLVTYTTLPIVKARLADETCPTCRLNATAGYGDCAPALGLDPAAVAAIHGFDI